MPEVHETLLSHSLTPLANHSLPDRNRPPATFAIGRVKNLVKTYENQPSMGTINFAPKSYQTQLLAVIIGFDATLVPLWCDPSATLNSPWLTSRCALAANCRQPIPQRGKRINASKIFCYLCTLYSRKKWGLSVHLRHASHANLSLKRATTMRVRSVSGPSRRPRAGSGVNTLKPQPEWRARACS